MQEERPWKAVSKSRVIDWPEARQEVLPQQNNTKEREESGKVSGDVQQKYNL